MCAVSSVGFAIVLRLSVVGFFKFLIWVVFIDCVGVGICVATLFWLVNSLLLLSVSKYLKFVYLLTVCCSVLMVTSGSWLD